MKYTFKLKEPKGDKETLILFSCFFKKESKKFIYSTGEKIHPVNWDFKTKLPISSGKYKSKLYGSIKRQLDRHSNLLIEKESQYKIVQEEFTTKLLKRFFDEEFKKTAIGRNVFFETYDEFTCFKIKNKEWSEATIKRYKNIKKLLGNFEEKKKFKLTFHNIDDNFHAEFKSYCMDDLNHINNTYARNLGLFKTFMFWSFSNKYTYNDAFRSFVKPKKVITNQIALSLEDLQSLMSFEFKSSRLEKVRDVFVFACVTGLRFGELSLIKKTNVSETCITIKENKDETKIAREIPLTSISTYLLKKYNYKLPLIANQKQNKYIKEVFKDMGYLHKVQKVTTKGKENIKEDLFFYDRISTHTARRTFITMLKSQGKSDKLIASITGHTDMKTLNQYYQVSEPEKKEAVNEVFDIAIPTSASKISEK